MLYYQHNRLGHALRRNTDYFGWIRINQHGFRGRDIPIAKPQGTLRVFAIGGSTTFDTQVTSDDRTWPARLEHWLNNLNPGHQVEVVNAGVPGYQVIDNLIRPQTDLYRFHPDIIILYQAHNDISCALRDERDPPRASSERPNAIRVLSPWRNWLDNHSLLYNKLVARWITIRGARGAVPPPPADNPAGELPRCGPEQFERDLRAFVAVAQQLGIRVVLTQVTHVSGVGATAERDSSLRARWWHVRPYAEPDLGLQRYVAYSEILQSIAQRFAVPFIETSDCQLKGAELYSEADPMHFNDRGAERMAHHLARALVDTGLLRSSSK
jgi:lysophospholipase L1-like esterase